MKRYQTTLLLVATALLMGPVDGLLLQDSLAVVVYSSRSYGRRSLRPYGLRPHRDFRKERKEKMENLEKSKTAAMENEMWQREFAGMLPAGYGSVQLAHMSSETKELLKTKVEERDRAMAEAQAAARERAEAEQAKAAAEAAAPPIQKAALDHIKAMSKFLAGQDQFEVFADELREEINQGQPVKIQTRQHMQVARPNQLRLKSQGLGTDSEVWFDGQEVTVMDLTKGSEMGVPVKGGVGELSDALYTRHGYVLPMADLLVDDLYAQAEPYITRAKYLGVSHVEGVECHHVAASSGTVDWEVWIQAKGDPAPRRILLRYREQPGAPRYGLTIHKMQPLKVTEETFAKPAAAE